MGGGQESWKSEKNRLEIRQNVKKRGQEKCEKRFENWKSMKKG